VFGLRFFCWPGGATRSRFREAVVDLVKDPGKLGSLTRSTNPNFEFDAPLICLALLPE
jgi:hypothetical protein